MNETRNQQEPSMEEILASIRRIISEDGQEPRLKPERVRTVEAEPEARARPGGAGPGEAGPGGQAEAPRRPGPASAGEGGGGADVLVLTEMLAEDGSVISLAARPSVAPVASDDDLSKTPETPSLPEPPGDPDATSVAEPRIPPFAADTPRRTDRPERSDEGADADLLQPQAEKAPATGADQQADQQMENEAVSNEARKKLNLVSEDAETASTAALAELARTVERSTDATIGGGRMVEDLVREALQPMLREWLDANLPGLVERLVRSEIQRIVRRAEDNA